MRWWQIRKRDEDLDRELQSDLELEEEEQRERGASPEEACYRARRSFGNTALIREHTHEAWGWAKHERLAQDIRYSLRQLRRSPGFTVASILILALGIGAVTAVFSLVDAALLKMLPVRDPEQLVQFKTIAPEAPVDDVFSYPTFQALKSQHQVLAGALAFRRLHDIDVEVEGRGGLAEGQLVSGNYFDLLGVKAVVGRTLLPVDDVPASPNNVAVISYGYWRSRFGHDPGVIGMHVLLNNAPFTIVGVTAPEFYGLQPGEKMAISVPLSTIASVNPAFAAAGGPADALKSAFRNWLYVIGRMQPGVSREQAASGLEPIFAASMREAADAIAGLPFASPAIRQSILSSRLRIEPGSQGLASLRREFSKPLWIVMAIVGLLLLITCANVANLLLARASAREKEIAVRLALGAGRARLMRQLLTESLLLGLGGGALGIILAWWGSHSLLAFLTRSRNPVSLSVHPDFTLLGFALGVSLATALIFGTIPAWRATHADSSSGLAAHARTSPGTGLRNRLGQSIVVLQIATSLVLVVGAGLLTRTLVNLRDFYPGFNQDNVLLFSVNAWAIGYQDAQLDPLYERLLDRLRSLPGVRLASLSVHQPLSTNVSSTAIKVQGPAAHPADDLTSVNIEPVGPDYFQTLEIPLLRGRDISWRDREGELKVAVVNESMARHYFGDADPIGRRIAIPGYRGDDSWLQIVGESRDIKVHDLRESATLMLYMPMFQAPEGGATFEVRTVMDPEAVQTDVLETVRSIDPRLPVYSVRSLDGQVNDSLVQERLVASLSEIFGLLALVLTCVGLYGLMAYTISRRTGEIGIRMALGAERGRIARMVLRETFLLVACGIAVGLPAAALTARWIASQLFGLKPWDPITLLGACAAMGAVAAAASYLPARRAASIDPMRALRTE
jgi:predicted permease